MGVFKVKYAFVTRGDDVSNEIADKIKKELIHQFEYDEINPDIVISIGGDGTILKAVHQYINKNCAFVGLHTGTLGFFTDFQIDELDDFIHYIKNNQYKIMNRHLLEIKIDKKDSEEILYALNELRLDQGLRTQVISVYINDVLFEVFRGNGLCVSTPSGSTGYNKSLGGAIIVAGIHHNAYRSLGSSMILDESQIIRLEGDQFDHLLIGIDHLHFELENVESIEVRISQKSAKFLEYKEMSFIKRVRRAFISS